MSAFVSDTVLAAITYSLKLSQYCHPTIDVRFSTWAAGKVPGAVHIVISGSIDVSVVLDGASAQLQQLLTLGRGSILGSSAVIAGQHATEACIVSSHSAQTFSISGDHWRQVT